MACHGGVVSVRGRKTLRVRFTFVWALRHGLDSFWFDCQEER